MATKTQEERRLEELEAELCGKQAFLIGVILCGINEQIQQRMKAMGISDHDMADRLGVSVAAWRKYLLGEPGVTVLDVAKSASFVGCGVDGTETLDEQFTSV
jgi:hypothetical protein